jgi:hypothetical protein
MIYLLLFAYNVPDISEIGNCNTADQLTSDFSDFNTVCFPRILFHD